MFTHCLRYIKNRLFQPWKGGKTFHQIVWYFITFWSPCKNWASVWNLAFLPLIWTLFHLTAALLEKFGDFLTSHDLQFGFKKGLGCQDAIFDVQQVTSCFTKHGSTVYFSALDASKAFDRVTHIKLFDKVIERNVPHCFIRVLHNWYSKLVSVVNGMAFLVIPFLCVAVLGKAVSSHHFCSIYMLMI